VIERVVENWLTSASERSLEMPFCQLLIGEGYQVVHLSRHGAAEEGKDIIAIAPDGVACGYQLKGAPNRRITLKSWRNEFYPQAVQLIEYPIKHPSIDPNRPRRAYWVTNGLLDEQVRLAIAHRNEEWKRRDYPVLQTVTKGELLRRFLDMTTNLWPTELASAMTLLELYLAPGTGCLDKGKLADFVVSLLPFFENSPSKAQCRRALAGGAILTAYALSPHTGKLNHVAVIEGWTVYVASLAALVEKHGLQEAYWRNSFEVSLVAIEQAFGNLCDELQGRTNLLEGSPLVDRLFFQARVTWLVGLVSAFALWKTLREPNLGIDAWFEEFVRSHRKDMLLWGEGAVPQFLAAGWFIQQTTGVPVLAHTLRTLIQAIGRASTEEGSSGLPDPYRSASEVIARRQGLLTHELPEYYKWRSYSLESLVHMFVRCGFRQSLRWLWPNITRMHYAEFRPESPWQFCLWRVEDSGRIRTSRPRMPQSWAELREEASETDLSCIPHIFKEYPELLLVFVLTYPHRLTKDVAKLLDDKLRVTRRR